MNKPVKSTDPRKKNIVANLKAQSGGTKVTNVRQTGENQFQGDCLSPPAVFDPRHRGWNRLGTFTTSL